MTISVSFMAIAFGVGGYYLQRASQVQDGGFQAGADARLADFLIDFHVSIAAREAINGFRPAVHDQTLERAGQVWPLDTVNASILHALVAINDGNMEAYARAKLIILEAAFGRVDPPSRVGPLTAFSIFGEITARSQDEASSASAEMLELASLVGYHAVQHNTALSERSRWLHYAEASCALLPVLPGCPGILESFARGRESPDDMGRRVLMSQPLRLGAPTEPVAPIHDSPCLSDSPGCTAADESF